VLDIKRCVQDYCIFSYWQEPEKNVHFWLQHILRNYLPVYFAKPAPLEKPYRLLSSVLGRTPNFLRTNRDFVWNAKPGRAKEHNYELSKYDSFLEYTQPQKYGSVYDNEKPEQSSNI